MAEGSSFLAIGVLLLDVVDFLSVAPISESELGEDSFTKAKLSSESLVLPRTRFQIRVRGGGGGANEGMSSVDVLTGAMSSWVASGCSLPHPLHSR